MFRRIKRFIAGVKLIGAVYRLVKGTKRFTDTQVNRIGNIVSFKTIISLREGFCRFSVRYDMGMEVISFDAKYQYDFLVMHTQLQTAKPEHRLKVPVGEVPKEIVQTIMQWVKNIEEA